ncbi:flagellar hook-basal body complex protein FliE [Fusibacter paucivorans]|uniref:Flagellar hook-basal body complex protein FliE n=1 Tax=Fusibacter paucivorans TaxID=76009 RepID=A0ABS5PUX0_9FIRM|nr:flagellar hook-basal body complex protein FliE [Fusibacter paucivorans]MBS7528391.1 flagellar hook-basal body complex protein FliE [Fusibacter paucivorans]
MKIEQLANSIINPNKKLASLNETLEADAPKFAEVLASSLQKVSDDQLYAEQMDQMLAVGEVENIHDVTIAAMKADMSISVAVDVTNKVLSAYNEIMRLQL